MRRRLLLLSQCIYLPLDTNGTKEVSVISVTVLGERKGALLERRPHVLSESIQKALHCKQWNSPPRTRIYTSLNISPRTWDFTVRGPS